MDLYVGTSGYSYLKWRGTFYPEGLPEKRILNYYGEHFRTVEVNSTFYRMPRVAVLEGWAEQVPTNFKFVLKASRRITHLLRLKNADDSLSYLFDVAGALKGRLGALLFQLPPDLPKDGPRLREFLALMPPERRVAFEFRHPSWFDREIFALLHDYNAALCYAEGDDDLQVPWTATGDWGYLRLRRSDYGDEELKRWVKAVRAQEWREVFIFFKHEESGKGPKLAARFLELAAA